MVQLGFYVNQDICTGCKACQVACKDRFDLDIGENFRKVFEISGGDCKEDEGVFKQDIYSFWISLSCNHCSKPVCVEVCPTGAMYKREEDGIVLVNKEECIGCEACKNACPYDAPVLIEKERKIGKCDLCINRIIDGKNPICVGACPVRAIEVDDIKNLRNKYGELATVMGIPENNTEANLVIKPHRNLK